MSKLKEKQLKANVDSGEATLADKIAKAKLGDEGMIRDALGQSIASTFKKSNLKDFMK